MFLFLKEKVQRGKAFLDVLRCLLFFSIEVLIVFFCFPQPFLSFIFSRSLDTEVIQRWPPAESLCIKPTLDVH